MVAPTIAVRPRWVLGLVAVILAVATVLALTLPRLVSSQIPGNRAQGVIPWLPLPAQLDAPVTPSPSPSPLPPGIRPCTSGQVQMNVLGDGGAGGHVFQSFGFSGRGALSCFLQGTPTVVVLDGSGKVLPFKTRASFLPSAEANPILIKPGPLPDLRSLTGLKAGQAGVTIEWVSQPEACPVGSLGVHLAEARITLPTGGAPFVAHVRAQPVGYVCAGLGVGTFQGPVLTVVEPSPLPLPSVTLRAPATVRAGGDLVYEVTLTNDTLGPIDLIANCPDYGQQLFAGDLPGGPPQALKPLFQLNCKPAGTISSGASLTFEMHLAIPRAMTPGTYSLFFTIGMPWDEMSTPTSARLTITK
jgi:hypothetical protein